MGLIILRVAGAQSAVAGRIGYATRIVGTTTVVHPQHVPSSEIPFLQDHLENDLAIIDFQPQVPLEPLAGRDAQRATLVTLEILEQ